MERFARQLNGLGVRISKGQIVTILTANKDVSTARKTPPGGRMATAAG